MDTGRDRRKPSRYNGSLAKAARANGRLITKKPSHQNSERALMSLKRYQLVLSVIPTIRGGARKVLKLPLWNTELNTSVLM